MATTLTYKITEAYLTVDGNEMRLCGRDEGVAYTELDVELMATSRSSWEIIGITMKAPDKYDPAKDILLGEFRQRCSAFIHETMDAEISDFVASEYEEPEDDRKTQEWKGL